MLAWMLSSPQAQRVKETKARDKADARVAERKGHDSEKKEDCVGTGKEKSHLSFETLRGHRLLQRVPDLRDGLFPRKRRCF